MALRWAHARHSFRVSARAAHRCCHFFDLMRLTLREEPVRVMGSGGQNVNHLDEMYEGKASDILDNAYVVVEVSDARARAYTSPSIKRVASSPEHASSP